MAETLTGKASELIAWPRSSYNFESKGSSRIERMPRQRYTATSASTRSSRTNISAAFAEDAVYTPLPSKNHRRTTTKLRARELLDRIRRPTSEQQSGCSTPLV